MTLLSVDRTQKASTPRSRALRYLPSTTVILDLVIVAGAGLLAILGRKHLWAFDSPADVSQSLTIAGPAIVIGWLTLMAAAGAYRQDVLGVGTEEYKRVVNASLLAAGLLSGICYLSKFQLSRGFFLLLFGVGLPVLVVGRFLLRRALHQARRQGKLQRRVLISGTPSHVDEIAAVFRRESWLGLHVEGALVPAAQLCEETHSGLRVVGACEDAVEVVQRSAVDVIFLGEGALRSASDLRSMAWDLEHADVQVVVAPSVTDVSAERVRVRPVGGLPLMHIEPPRTTDAASWGKRLFDIAGSLALLVALAPVFLVVAVRIKIHDGGPVLFRQTRVGRNGEPFTCLKFRTMVIDAEERLAALHAEIGHVDGLFKMAEDPRITTPGRWLRRYSIDELPQLINALRGEMSLVGPRPPLPREVAAYENRVLRRLRVRPGMTGLWQVSGRSDLSWEEAVRLDLYYVDNWSMVQDVNILAKTFKAVLGSHGAY